MVEGMPLGPERHPSRALKPWAPSSLLLSREAALSTWSPGFEFQFCRGEQLPCLQPACCPVSTQHHGIC